MTDYDLGNHLKVARNGAKLSQQELAKKLDITDKTLRNYEKGNNITVDFVRKLSKICNTDFYYLLEGDKNEKKSTQKIKGNNNNQINGNNYIQSNKKDDKIIESNLVEIPYFQDTYAAAGAGALNYDEVPVIMAFDSNFLKIHLKITSFKHLHIINSIGNSMEPTLKEGELLFVNPFENESHQIKDGGIYVINCNNGVLVKRINHNPINGNIVLVSDNKSVADISITGEEFESCSIIGRVVGHFSGL